MKIIGTVEKLTLTIGQCWFIHFSTYFIIFARFTKIYRFSIYIYIYIYIISESINRFETFFFNKKVLR